MNGGVKWRSFVWNGGLVGVDLSVGEGGRVLLAGRLVERTDVNVFVSQAVELRLIHRGGLKLLEESKQRSDLIRSVF